MLQQSDGSNTKFVPEVIQKKKMSKTKFQYNKCNFLREEMQ